MYVAWSEGWNSYITSSLITSFVATLLIAAIITLFLYHVTVGRGDPVAEQLTLIDALMLETVIVAGDVEVNSGGSGKR